MDQDNQTSEQSTPQESSPSLALADLVLLFNIVKLAADRGAIRVEEMSAVGTVYDKLGKFLQASGVFQSPPNPDTTN